MNTGGMTLEELVRQMQAQANAQKQTNNNSSTNGANSSTSRVRDSRNDDYVDFEEIK